MSFLVPKAPSMPSMQYEPPSPTEGADAEETKAKMEKAAKMQRNAKGRSSTILTSGLQIDKVSTSKKYLLGN